MKYFRVVGGWSGSLTQRAFLNRVCKGLVRRFYFEVWSFSPLITFPSFKNTTGKRYIYASKSISTGAQYLTPKSKIYCEKVKMCRFSSGNWFFCTKFIQLAVASKRHNTVVHLQKRV